MDNAVKALIIAGAVLIAILLIGVGITIFNSASKPLDQGQKQADQQAITMFNNNIMANLGEDISSSTVKTLFSVVTSSNAENTDHPIALFFNKVKGNEGDGTEMTSISGVSSKNRYKTEESYDGNGYINKIVIKTK